MPQLKQKIPHAAMCVQQSDSIIRIYSFSAQYYVTTYTAKELIKEFLMGEEMVH